MAISYKTLYEETLTKKNAEIRQLKDVIKGLEDKLKPLSEKTKCLGDGNHLYFSDIIEEGNNGESIPNETIQRLTELDDLKYEMFKVLYGEFLHRFIKEEVVGRLRIADVRKFHYNHRVHGIFYDIERRKEHMKEYGEIEDCLEHNCYCN